MDNSSGEDDEPWTRQTSGTGGGPYKSTSPALRTQAHSELHPKGVMRTPLPKFQLFLVMLIQVAEPITGLVIYPFINQFIRDTGVTKGDDRKVGYYAGIIVSRALVPLVCLMISCRNRLSSLQRHSRCSSGDGYPTVLEENPCYYLVHWVSCVRCLSSGTQLRSGH